MVEWIRLQNKLKLAASRELLAPSQRVAFCQLEDLMKWSNRINLFGVCGSGKTFLAWVMSKELGILYLPGPLRSKYSKYNSRVIAIDDAPSNRDEARALCSEALERASCVILLTRSAIEDHLLHVELRTSLEDLVFIRNTLMRLGGPFNTVSELRPGLLWNLFRIDF